MIELIVWELREGGLVDLQHQLHQGPDRSPAADRGTGMAVVARLSVILLQGQLLLEQQTKKVSSPESRKSGL